MQLNQKGDYLSLMTEGVVVVPDWNERHCHFNVLATAGGVLRKRVNDVFLVWDMDWQCFHKRLCRHSLSTLEVQHLFKQIKFSYFTFDALNFLLTKSLIEPHSLFSHFSQSSIIDLGWGNLLSSLCMHDKCMSM